MSETLAHMAEAVLRTPDGHEKAALSADVAARWFAARMVGAALEIGTGARPDRPARPAAPVLLDPREVPRRRPDSAKGRLAILHAVAHIELNAIDLHWDIVARFTKTPMPLGYYDDWVKAAAEEASHFNMMSGVLESHGSHYGALPAHAGMWRAAQDTQADLIGRLAAVPMVLEARGLDVTPDMIALFERAGDDRAVAALRVIYAEEVGHVAYGSKWFHFLCGRHELDPKDEFHTLVRRYFHGGLKPPFNEEKRAEAGLPPDFYWPLAARAPDR